MLSSHQVKLHNKRQLGELTREQVDLSKDPYFRKNNLGAFECRLCGTNHLSEASYFSHTGGRRHTFNLSKRMQLESAKTVGAESLLSPPPVPGGSLSAALGAAGSGSKQRRQPRIQIAGDAVVYTRGQAPREVPKSRYQLHKATKTLVITVECPKIDPGLSPQHRLISAVEQTVESPQDLFWQYLVIAAPPYLNIAYKIPASFLKPQEHTIHRAWDIVKRVFQLTIEFG